MIGFAFGIKNGDVPEKCEKKNYKKYVNFEKISLEENKIAKGLAAMLNASRFKLQLEGLCCY